ncbi:MAG: permease [Elusimicrobiota bacterium]
MLQIAVNWFIYSIIRLNPETSLAQSVNFFVYDTIKILLLLFAMITVMGFLRSFIPQNKIKNWLSKKKGFGNVLASMFGAITPFCSCSSIPIFISFLEAGIPLGVTFSFLITSPLVNEYLVVLMIGFFGWKITIIYVLLGIVVGVISGIILGKMKLEKYLVKDFVEALNEPFSESVYSGVIDRIKFGLHEAKAVIQKIWKWVLFGVAVGALIHNYMPQELINSVINKTGIFSVPIAVLLGVPMYGSCAAIVPIAVVLFQKGIPLGTALAFMMAIAGLSLPEAIILRRAMKLKLIAIFFGITTLGILLSGYIINYFNLKV